MRIAATAVLLGAAPAAPRPFSVGETLTYDAKLGLFPAGSARTTVERLDTDRGARVYVFGMTGAGGPPGLRAEYAMTSWTGVDPFTSRRFDRRVTLAGRTEEHHFQIVPDSQRYRELGGAEDWVAPSAPLDELALLYYLRTIDLSPGESRSLRGYFRNGYNPLTVRAVAVEPILLGRGTTVSCAHLRITAVGTTSDVWLTEDARKLPAQLELATTFGRVRLVLR
jgi:uncharacterized protein DUF3108